jgi:hypothetical protein
LPSLIALIVLAGSTVLGRTGGSLADTQLEFSACVIFAIAMRPCWVASTRSP